MGEGANEFVINVNPVPASRPRVTKWGTYYGKNYERFRRDVRNEIHSHKGKKLFGPIIALVEIICPRPKTIERLFLVAMITQRVIGLSYARVFLGRR